jgi:Domain of unknown function (DUF4396)
MAPTWLTVVAWLYLSVCFCCAGFIAYDIFVNRRRQPMGVMNFVFPITALYFGPLAVALYWRWGWAARATPPPMSASPAMVSPTAASAGCTLGDVISEFAVFALGLTIAGAALGAEYIGDYILALVFGIIFQYFAIAPMRGLGVKDDLIAAAKADCISLTAFEVGLFGWMAVHGLRAVPGTAPPHAQHGRLLAPHTGRHDDRIFHLLARQCLADQTRHQGSHVSPAPWTRQTT